VVCCARQRYCRVASASASVSSFHVADLLPRPISGDSPGGSILHTAPAARAEWVESAALKAYAAVSGKRPCRRKLRSDIQSIYRATQGSRTLLSRYTSGGRSAGKLPEALQDFTLIDVLCQNPEKYNQGHRWSGNGSHGTALFSSCNSCVLRANVRRSRLSHIT
jgi:hypothetical protein